jgi:small-conductance mechanosensitive channel
MNLKFNNKPYIAILFISGFLLVSGYSQVASAQETTQTPIPTLQSTPGATSEPIDTPKPTDQITSPIVDPITPTVEVTPTPTSDPVTSGSSNLTPEGVLAVVIITPPGALTPTPTSGSGFSVDLSDLTLETLVQSLISIALIIIVAILGSRLIYLVLRRLVRRTDTEFDDQLLETIRPQIIWLLAAMGFQFITNRAAFLSGDVFETIYFFLYWFVAAAIAWRSIDFASAWYLDHLTAKERQLPESMVTLLRRLSQITLIFIASAILLGYFGVNILAVSAALGLGGFAIALAAKDSITNIISGFVLMFTQPFEIGDRIDVPAVDTWGDVIEIGMRSTKVITRDNRLVIIPNSAVVDNYVVNYSQPDPTYRLQTDIGIGSGENIADVVRILNDSVRRVEGVLADKNVDVLFTGFGDSSNTFRVRWWVASYADKRRVTHNVCTAIQEAADKEGIDMPYTTFTLDNQLKINPDDIDEITQSPASE